MSWEETTGYPTWKANRRFYFFDLRQSYCYVYEIPRDSTITNVKFENYTDKFYFVYIRDSTLLGFKQNKYFLPFNPGKLSKSKKIYYFSLSFYQSEETGLSLYLFSIDDLFNATYFKHTLKDYYDSYPIILKDCEIKIILER